MKPIFLKLILCPCSINGIFGFIAIKIEHIAPEYNDQLKEIRNKGIILYCTAVVLNQGTFLPPEGHSTRFRDNFICHKSAAGRGTLAHSGQQSGMLPNLWTHRTRPARTSI